MTAQINDTVFHRKIEFSLAGISGSGLFQPEQHGLKPAARCSACWRGYIAHYTIVNGSLFLRRLHIFLSEEDSTRARSASGQELFGAKPIKAEFGSFLYDNFLVPIQFSGGMLLANGFIQELYVHMGFHPAWKYQIIREVLFEDGKLLDDIDRSSQMAQVRTEAAKKLHSGLLCSNPSSKEISAWVRRCFSRDYNKS